MVERNPTKYNTPDTHFWAYYRSSSDFRIWILAFKREVSILGTNFSPFLPMSEMYQSELEGRMARVSENRDEVEITDRAVLESSADTRRAMGLPPLNPYTFLDRHKDAQSK